MIIDYQDLELKVANGLYYQFEFEFCVPASKMLQLQDPPLMQNTEHNDIRQSRPLMSSWVF